MLGLCGDTSRAVMSLQPPVGENLKYVPTVWHWATPLWKLRDHAATTFQGKLRLLKATTARPPRRSTLWISAKTSRGRVRYWMLKAIVTRSKAASPKGKD